MATQKQQITLDSEDDDTAMNDETEDLEAVQLDEDDVVEVELGGRDERADLRTVASRQRLHDKLLSDVEAFLANGGHIDYVSSYTISGAPKRHVNKFGNNIV